MTARVLKAPDVEVAAHAPLPPESIRAAIEAAFAQGRAIGRTEGARALEAELAMLRGGLTRVGDEVRDVLAASVTLDASTVAALAADLAAWFLNGVAVAAPEQILASLQPAIAKMAGEGNLVLHLHPSVIESLGSDESYGALALRGDATLSPADFRITGDATTVERQWHEAIEQLSPDLTDVLQMDRDHAV